MTTDAIIDKAQIDIDMSKAVQETYKGLPWFLQRTGPVTFQDHLNRVDQNVDRDDFFSAGIQSSHRSVVGNQDGFPLLLDLNTRFAAKPAQPIVIGNTIEMSEMASQLNGSIIAPNLGVSGSISNINGMDLTGGTSNNMNLLSGRVNEQNGAQSPKTNTLTAVRMRGTHEFLEMI